MVPNRTTELDVEKDCLTVTAVAKVIGGPLVLVSTKNYDTPRVKDKLRINEHKSGY